MREDFRKLYIVCKSSQNAAICCKAKEKIRQSAAGCTIYSTFCVPEVCSRRHDYLDLEKEHAARVCRLIIGNLSL